MPLRQVITIRKRDVPVNVDGNVIPKVRWTCGFPHCAHAEKWPLDMRQHIRTQHTAENVLTDYEWLSERGEIQHWLDSACYVKVKGEGGEVVPRSFVHSQFCHECAIEEHGLDALLLGQLTSTQLDDFQLAAGEHGVCCACGAAFCQEKHLPAKPLYPIWKKANKSNTLRLFVGESKDKERLLVCNECAVDHDRLTSASSIRYYQRNLAALRRRVNFKVKAVLCLREHPLGGGRSICAPRIKPIKHSEKCCECRCDLNPCQGKNCVRKDQGIEAYDRGDLVSEFARLPNSQYETDAEDFLQWDSRYDSDDSYDFEKELERLDLPARRSESPTSTHSSGADPALASLLAAAAAVPKPYARLPDVSAPSVSEAASQSDPEAADAETINLVDNSDSEDYVPKPPPVISASLQRYIQETFRHTVAELRGVERSTLQKNFAYELEKLKTLAEYKAEVKSLRQQRAVDKKALEFASRQVLQLSADRADNVARANLLQSVNERIEKHQEKMQKSLDDMCEKVAGLENAQNKRFKANEGSSMQELD